MDTVRLMITEIYALSRMFRIFKKQNSNPGDNPCDNKPQERIIYFGGLYHTNNISNILHKLLSNNEETELFFVETELLDNYSITNNRVISINPEYLDLDKLIN